MKYKYPIKSLLAITLMAFIPLKICAQKKTKTTVSERPRPRLVVGIVVDPMRWDYLYRYYSRYCEGGFKRLLREGFTCENTYINYLPSVTAVGHSAIFTGSTPAINGIANNEADFLTINCASTDYVGHMFGPNAIETEDTYLRLDRDLARFFSYLDEKVAKGNYTVFLTADHGASNSVQYNKAHNIPAGLWKQDDYKDKLNQILKARFNTDQLIISINEYQVNFNIPKIKKNSLDYTAVKKAVVEYLQDEPSTLFVADMAKINEAVIPELIKTKMINGYNYRRSGGVLAIPTAEWLQAKLTGTEHGEWNPHDTHIPLIFMGWGIKADSSQSSVYTTDIAPTVAALLHIQAPNGCVGKPIKNYSNNRLRLSPIRIKSNYQTISPMS